VILIDHFNGREEATRCLAGIAREAALSVITRAEVLAGFDSSGAAAALGLLDRFPTLIWSRGTHAISPRTGTPSSFCPTCSRCEHPPPSQCAKDGAFFAVDDTGSNKGSFFELDRRVPGIATGTAGLKKERI
jgi:hypothetical protein